MTLNMKLEDGNVFRGDLTITSLGYEAFNKREKILSNGGSAEYAGKFQKVLSELIISDYSIENLEDVSKPLIEKMKVESKLEVSNPSVIYLNPFMVERWEKNPLKSPHRMYPVDFGAPVETSFMLNLEYPAQYVVEELPPNAAVALPQGGGRYLFNATNQGNKITLSSLINLSKTVYLPDEYPALREMYNRVVQLHQSQVVFKR